MTDLILCPFCHSETTKLTLKKVGESNCCPTCEYFVSAINSSYSWFNPMFLEKRSHINDRYPLVNRTFLRNILQKFVRDTGISGVFNKEDEIIHALRELREVLYKKFETEIRSYERYHLLNDSLNAYDFLCTVDNTKNSQISSDKYSSINSLVNQNKSLQGLMSVFGKTLEWIIECALSYDNFSPNPGTTQQSLIYLIELGNEINFINSLIEQVAGLWHRGNLAIGQSFWSWKLLEEDQKFHDSFVSKWNEDSVVHSRIAFGNADSKFSAEKYVDELKKADKLEKATDNSILGFDTEEFICSINHLHQLQFGHKYNQLLVTLLTIGTLVKKLDRDWIFQEEILSFMADNLRYTNEVSISILNHLCISYSQINSESHNPFEFKRKYRINRRPLPKIKVGLRIAYYISPMILFRTFLHLQVEYTEGNYPELIGTEIEKEIQKLKQSYSDYFEQVRIYPIFVNNGYVGNYRVKKIPPFNLEKECGEIDILVFNQKNNELVIGECKHRVGKQIHVSQIRQEIENFTDPKNGFVKKITKKVSWIRNHKNDVFRYLNIPIDNTETIYKPIFITNIYSPASEIVKDIEFVQELNLDSWLKNRNNAQK